MAMDLVGHMQTEACWLRPDKQPTAKHQVVAPKLLVACRPAHLFPVPQESNCSRPQLLRVCLHGVLSQGPQHLGHALELDFQPPPLELLQGEHCLLHPAATRLFFIQVCKSTLAAALMYASSQTAKCQKTAGEMPAANIAHNKTSGDELQFNTLKDCSQRFGVHLAFKKQL